ncbi:MAG: methylmalonyl-CoA epimerase [Actinobacteria bacterium]|nr:methylmalonyl-CoA epimerase [Actinomycetota bacterium]
MNAFASQPPIIPNIPGIIGFDHVGVAVADLNEGITFYQNIFGAVLLHQEINSAQGVHEAMLSIGTTGNSTLQLLAPLTPESPIGKFLSKNGPGIQQLALTVKDLQAAMDAAVDLGIRVLNPLPVVGTKGVLINFLHPKDCGGVLIELVQAH